MSASPTSQTLPTIVIFHDAWHTPIHYSKMIDLLSAQGFEVACPQLPSCSSEQNNTSSFNDDANFVYALVFDIASDAKNIICVMHGYGGYVGTETLGDLSASQRAQNGLSGGVVHMVWISAVLPDTGVSMQMAMGGDFPEYTPLQRDGTLAIAEPDRYIFNDLGAMEMVHWCEHLVRWSARAADIVCSTDTPAYLVCPSTYIICSQDQLISETGQCYMIMAAQKKGAIIDEQLLEAAGHDPMCSDPEAVVGIISSVAAALLDSDLEDGEDGDDGNDCDDGTAGDDEDAGNDGNDGDKPAIAQTDGPSDETIVEATTPEGTRGTVIATIPTSTSPPPTEITEPTTTQTTVVERTTSHAPEEPAATTTPPPDEPAATTTPPPTEPAVITTVVPEPAVGPTATTTIITTTPAVTPEATSAPVTVIETSSTPPAQPQPTRTTTIPLITPLVVSFGGVTSIIPAPHSPTDELYAPQTPPPTVVVEPSPTVVVDSAPAPVSTASTIIASASSPPPEPTTAAPSRTATVVIAPPARAATPASAVEVAPTTTTINVSGDYYPPAGQAPPTAVYVSGNYYGTGALADSTTSTNDSTRAQAETEVVVVQEEEGRCRRRWLRCKACLLQRGVPVST